MLLASGIRLSREIKVAPSLAKMKSFGGETGISFSGRGPERWHMESVRYPNYMAPLSVVPTRTKSIHGITFEPSCLQELAESCQYSKFHTGFSLWIYSHRVLCAWI